MRLVPLGRYIVDSPLMGPGSLPKAREGNALSMAAAAPEMCVTIVRKCESIPGQQSHIQRGNARNSKTEKKATFFFTHHLRMGVHPEKVLV